MKKRKDRAMSDWDNLVEPTRGALEALLRKGDAMADRIEELEAKLAKAMIVVEMIASADVDVVLGQAVDLSCEIIGDLMEEEDQ
jgi:transcription elongation GreA/GreB family factor